MIEYLNENYNSPNYIQVMFAWIVDMYLEQAEFKFSENQIKAVW